MRLYRLILLIIMFVPAHTTTMYAGVIDYAIFNNKQNNILYIMSTDHFSPVFTEQKKFYTYSISENLISFFGVESARFPVDFSRNSLFPDRTSFDSDTMLRIISELPSIMTITWQSYKDSTLFPARDEVFYYQKKECLPTVLMEQMDSETINAIHQQLLRTHAYHVNNDMTPRDSDEMNVLIERGTLPYTTSDIIPGILVTLLVISGVLIVVISRKG